MLKLSTYHAHQESWARWSGPNEFKKIVVAKFVVGFYDQDKIHFLIKNKG